MGKIREFLEKNTISNEHPVAGNDFADYLCMSVLTVSSLLPLKLLYLELTLPQSLRSLDLVGIQDKV